MIRYNLSVSLKGLSERLPYFNLYNNLTMDINNETKGKLKAKIQYNFSKSIHTSLFSYQFSQMWCC